MCKCANKYAVYSTILQQIRQLAYFSAIKNKVPDWCMIDKFSEHKNSVRVRYWYPKKFSLDAADSSKNSKIKRLFFIVFEDVLNISSRCPCGFIPKMLFLNAKFWILTVSVKNLLPRLRILWYKRFAQKKIFYGLYLLYIAYLQCCLIGARKSEFIEIITILTTLIIFFRLQTSLPPQNEILVRFFSCNRL